MSFKAVFEVFLQIHEFINIDLPSQGIFQLRVSIYQQQAKQKIYAMPFEFMQASKKSNPSSKKIQSLSSTQPPYFLTKAGSIKYSDQKLTFQDLVRFKLQIQSFPRLHSQNIILQFQLIFSQFCYSSSTIPSGTIVESKKFKLQNLQLGILNYCQGQFTGNYSSKFTFTLFTCLSNFKFGKYKLFNQMEAIQRMDQNGEIVVQKNKSNENVRKKQLDRSKITTFEEFFKWAKNYYSDKVPNPVSYFYKTYVKNLRYYFYLAQQKLNQNSLIKQKQILKVPKQFLELPPTQQQKSQKSYQTQTSVSQKQFHKYITNYQPKNLTPNNILQQINIIYNDIYMFLMQVQKQFQLDQLMIFKMKKQYHTYVKQRYGDRVFKYTLKSGDLNCQSKENKKIAQKMRKKSNNVITYPIEDIDFTQGKQALQYLFYQITDPKILKQTIKSTQKQQSKTIKKQQTISSQSLKQQKNLNINNSLTQSAILNQQQYIIKQVLINQNKQTKIQQPQQLLQNKKQAIVEKQQLDKLIDRQAKIIQDSLYDQPNIAYQQKQKQGQIDDVYANVNHQKGSIDSQLSQKSFENQNINRYANQNQSNQFSDISQIQCKNQNNKQSINKLEQLFSLPKLNYTQKNMLIVMCHGFQGSSYDMTILLRGLRQLIPNASYLTARSNQGKTEGDIQQMGQRLATQVQNYISNYMDEQNVILNFIGHSMGGIVARAGIKYLSKKYYDKYGFFCSLSTPHLGYLSGVDGMIKAGLWAILKFKPIKSLQQLKMDDSKDFRKTYLYKLSKQGNLKRFRKIILFSSFQDSYVSWHSARISNHHKKTEISKIEQQMVANILGNQQIHRIDVNFNVRTKNLDSFIGRTAHINLIIQQSLFKIIQSAIPQLFDISQF